MSRKMKDSGVDWIGLIPEGWKINSIGSLYTQRNVKVSDLDYAPLSVTKNGIVPQLETAAKSSNHGNRKLVLKNDFVINSRSDRKMSAGLSSLDGSVSVINTVLESDYMASAYTSYLLKNVSFAEEFYKWGTGIVDDLWSTRWNKMKSISIPVPSKQIQLEIANLLNRKTSEIDNIIDMTKQSIEELKAYKQSLITETVTKGLNPDAPMKDSGIEWIGKIPNNWDTTAIKRIFKVVSGGTPKTNISQYWDGEIPWITPADFNTEMHYISEGVKNISKKGLENSSANLIPMKSLILSKRAPIGKVIINTSALTTNQGCLASIPKLDNIVDIEYIYYLLSILTEQLNMLGSGTTFKELSLENYKNFWIPLPSLNEQYQITEYLIKRTNKIDNLIKQKQEMIKELESYKQSLIYEYVTGKKEVE